MLIMEWVQVPYLSADEVVEFAAAGGGVGRVVAAFEESDLLWATGLHPRCWDNPEWAALPNMAVRTVDGRWAGITGVNVGYGGTGPRYALAVLQRLGLAEDLVYEIVRHRFSDVYLDRFSSRRVFTREWPHYQYGTPKLLESGVSLVTLTARPGGLTRAAAPTDPGPAQVAPDGAVRRWHRSQLAAYLALLDDPERPDWLGTYREITLWPSHTAAQDAGQQVGHQAYPLKISQGDLELWIDLDITWTGVPPQLVGDALTALRRLDCPPDLLHRLTEPSRARRLGRYLLGERPDVVQWASTVPHATLGTRWPGVI